MLITFIGVFWSMGGWHHATYLAGESINPEKTVPRAMITGTMLVTLIYISVIASYMMLLPADVIAQSDKVAGEAMGKYLSWGNYFITTVITISIFGTIGIYTMTAPRIYYAMAKDGLFFSFTADVCFFRRYGQV
jgi:APA family basic amino acid/polyamine antiporter